MATRQNYKGNIGPNDRDTTNTLLAKLLKALGPGGGDKVIVTGTTDNEDGPYYRIYNPTATNLVLDTFTAADWNGGAQVTGDLTILPGESLFSSSGFTQVKFTSGSGVLFKMS